MFLKAKTNNAKEKNSMNIKCEHCGHEGPKETFNYLYNIRLDDGISWRECPKCYGWNFCSEEDGSIVDFSKHAVEYPTHADA